MKKLEFSLPSDFKENIQIIDKRTESYDPKESAQELYESLKKLPVSTLDEFQKIVDKNPYYSYLDSSLPSDLKEDIQIIGKRNQSYDPKESAQELYRALRKLPATTLDEFQEIVDKNPYYDLASW